MGFILTGRKLSSAAKVEDERRIDTAATEDSGEVTDTEWTEAENILDEITTLTVRQSKTEKRRKIQLFMQKIVDIVAKRSANDGASPTSFLVGGITHESVDDDASAGTVALAPHDRASMFRRSGAIHALRQSHQHRTKLGEMVRLASPGSSSADPAVRLRALDRVHSNAERQAKMAEAEIAEFLPKVDNFEDAHHEAGSGPSRLTNLQMWPGKQQVSPLRNCCPPAEQSFISRLIHDIRMDRRQITAIAKQHGYKSRGHFILCRDNRLAIFSTICTLLFLAVVVVSVFGNSSNRQSKRK